MPSRYRCCVEADIQATGVAAKRLARRLHPDVTQSLLSLHVKTRRIRIEAGAVCVLAYGNQKKRCIREAMILIGRGNRCRTCSTKSYLFSAGRLTAQSTRTRAEVLCRARGCGHAPDAGR